MDDSAVLASLPGSEIVLAGLRDLELGRQTANAQAVLMASSRLRALGLPAPASGDADPPASHRLYELLAAEEGAGAHSRYNAILGRVVSFLRAAERASAG